LKKIGNNGATKDCLSENAGCLPLAVIIMRTANRRHLALSGRHLNFLSYLIFTEIAPTCKGVYLHCTKLF